MGPSCGPTLILSCPSSAKTSLPFSRSIVLQNHLVVEKKLVLLESCSADIMLSAGLYPLTLINFASCCPGASLFTAVPATD